MYCNADPISVLRSRESEWSRDSGIGHVREVSILCLSGHVCSVRCVPHDVSVAFGIQIIADEFCGISSGEMLLSGKKRS